MEELKDIKGLVEVPDSSFADLMMLMGAGVMVILLLVAIMLWLKKPKRRRQRATPAEIAKAQLQAINFEDTKESVYAFSEATQILDPEHQGIKQLLEQLEQYKYQREIPPLSEEDKKTMKKIIKEITHAK